MKSTLTKEEENLAIVTMVIPSNEATSAYNTAANRISQNVNIDGFRKGKAPRNVIERHVGVDRIRHEALEILLPKYLGQAVYDNKLDIITQPAVIGYKFEEGEDLEVTFEVETRPEVKLGAYKDLNVKAEIPAPDEGAFDKALEGFLTQNSSLELVLDRQSNDTDIVVIDFEGTCNDEPIQGGSAKGYALDLAHSNFIPGFAEQLVGHNINDEFTINVTFPEEYHDEKLKGQPATFSIKMKEIKHRVMPELTDDLVKKASRFSTVDELKEDIGKYIDAQKESIRKASAENVIFRTVYDSTEVNIPDRMINREVNSLVNEYRQRVSYQGGKWEDFIKSQGGETELRNRLIEEAKTRIKNSLIIDKISKEEKISVEQSDFSDKINQVSAAYGVTPQDMLKQFGQNPDFLQSLSQQIVNDKVRAFLLSNNNVEYVEVKSEN